MQYVHRLMAVAADGVDAGNAMPARLNIRRHDLLRFSGRDLQGQALIAVVERLHGFRGNKLEKNGISRIQPAEQKAEYAQDAGVEHKYLRPDGLSRFVGNVKGNKVRAAGGGIALQGKDNADTH